MAQKTMRGEAYRILLVEDDEDLRTEVASFLSSEGYEVASVANGRAALEHLKRSAAPDVILLDLQMPVMDGWEFRLAQRSDAFLASIPVVIVSGDRRADEKKLDAEGFLAKPFDDEQLLACIRDVVQRTTRERTHVAHLAQADRMISLGLLAAGVAHEINNPLAFVIANLGFLSDRLAELAPRVPADQLKELRDIVTETAEGAERIRKVARDLKVFSRAEKEEMRRLDLRAVLDMAVTMSWNEVRHRARLVKDYGDTPEILGDEARLGQVFINLLVNAAQAVVEGRADKNVIRIVSSFQDGRVVVEVSDTGRGIPPADRPRLFEPFFTTKPTGVGTGLGLYVCRDIVTAHGGTIAITSDPGRGTTVRVELPPAAGVPRIPTPEPMASVQSDRARVLVIDDESMICTSIQRALGGEYDVLTTSSSSQARDWIVAGERFDAIVCDVMMPVLTGMELYAELRRSVPEQAKRILFLTGGAFTARARAFLDEVPNPWLEKPFEVDRLRAAVRERTRC
jgi:signal transduction histidine kinase